MQSPLFSLLLPRGLGAVLGTSLVAALCLGACTMDPVNSAQEAAQEALPDDGPLPNSEFHRPGQDCMACHGPRGGAKAKFLIAGTVFWGVCIDPEGGPDVCQKKTVAGAEVRIFDAASGKRCVRTNCAGNFFIRDGEWALRDSRSARPQFPLLSSVRKQTSEGAAVTQVMAGHIGRSGSCNDCHRGSPFWNSAGQIYLYRENGQIPASAETENLACQQNPQPSPENEEDCVIAEAE